MKTLTQFIKESVENKIFSDWLVKEYQKQIQKFKDAAVRAGYEIVSSTDNFKHLYITSKNEDILQDYIDMAEMLYRDGKENYPLPCDAEDVHIIDSNYDKDKKIIYFCAWLGLNPTDAPETTYLDAKGCYGDDTDKHNKMYHLWLDLAFNNPDMYLEALMQQIIDMRKVFDKLISDKV